eukprot:7387224-Prymnesium_polylepis.1
MSLTTRAIASCRVRFPRAAASSSPTATRQWRRTRALQSRPGEDLRDLRSQRLVRDMVQGLSRVVDV